MSRKLCYFNFNGYAESIRYMLHYGGLEFKDVKYSFQEWPEMKQSMPYGQVPVYEEDGRVLNQSMAIARYVASKTGLLPEGTWEQAKLDAAVLNIYDFIKKLVDYYWEIDPIKKEANKKTLDEAIPYFLSRFEKELTAGEGHFSKKLSWADFVLVAAIELYELYLLDTTLHEGYPNITALITEIRSLPGVKEYIAKRTPYVRPKKPENPEES